MMTAEKAARVAVKRFLFLQGHPTFFWVRLGDALRAEGHVVRKIRLSGLDHLFWPRRGAESYRGRLEDWRAWLADYLAREGITDILYYADRQPYHVEALAAAKALGLRAWAVEFGYLRPHWLTLEPEAMGAFSRFPKDPDAIRALAANASPPQVEGRYGHSFFEETVFDILRYAALVIGWPLFPRYQSDAPFGMVKDYYHWVRTLAKAGKTEAEARKVEATCHVEGADYTLLAMQLAHDYQIRASTHYDHLADMVEEVFTSLMRAAPASRRLVIKLHPLDNGMQNWPERISAIAARTGAEGRYDLIQGGDLGPMIQSAKSVVLANSTVGLHALRMGVPVKALGAAVYDLPGLTHQGDLDAFWTHPDPVNEELERAFVAALAKEIQVEGAFYNRAGQIRAIDGIVERLTRRPYPAWALEDQPGQDESKA